MSVSEVGDRLPEPAIEGVHPEEVEVHGDPSV